MEKRRLNILNLFLWNLLKCKVFVNYYLDIFYPVSYICMCKLFSLSFDPDLVHNTDVILRQVKTTLNKELKQFLTYCTLTET